MRKGMPAATANRSGFTLVELSIVLVILGLLIGGVLTGQSLIRAAELRSVSTQYSRYITAVQTFRDKYFALPGDMTNADKYWGLQVSGTTCVTQASSDAKTCNGDGDGKISYASTNSNESFRFWQHLANAGLIEGSYDGVQHGTLAFSATNLNSPAGRISGSYWFVFNWGTMSGNTNNMFDGVYENTLEFGTITTNSDPSFALFKPEDAYNIDTKLDDGMPATGKLVVRTTSAATFAACTNGSSTANLTATYLLTNQTIACALMFRNQF